MGHRELSSVRLLPPYASKPGFRTVVLVFRFDWEAERAIVHFVNHTEHDLAKLKAQAAQLWSIHVHSGTNDNECHRSAR